MSKSNGRSDGEVLLCYDGSDESANAIARAGELLGGRRATVAHVWSGLSSLMLHAPLAGPPTGPLAEGAEMIDEPEKERGERRAAEGAELARTAGFEARPVALEEEQNVWQTLRDYAADHASPVVVAGARGRSRLASVLLGSVSSGLVHHPPAPVFVVPGTARAHAPGPIVYCDDGSDNARRGIEVGHKLLRGPGLVLTVWRSWVVSVPYMAVGAGMAVGMAEDLDKTAEEQALAVSDDGAELVRAGGNECSAEGVRFDGPIWRGLIDAANDRQASAIVIGARGLTGIANALGSVASAIVHHSPRAVLVVPPAQQPDRDR